MVATPRLGRSRVNEIISAVELDNSLILRRYDNTTIVFNIDSSLEQLVPKSEVPEVFIVAVSDETTALTTGTSKVTFRWPYQWIITDVRAVLTTASSSGNPTFDVNESGASIFSGAKLSIDSGEKTSETATIPHTLYPGYNAQDDAEVTIDIDIAGTGATGAKIYFYGTRNVL